MDLSFHMSFFELVSNIASVVLLDLALGGDNAAVIGMAAKNLPHNLRKKAIVIGAGGALGCRFVLAAVAVWLMQIPYLKTAGAVILMYIGAKLIGQHGEDSGEDTQVESKNTLMGAVVTIIAADAIMSLDNVLAIVGATHGHLGMLVLGMAFSIPIILFGSAIVVKIMDKFPIVIYMAGMLIGWSSGGMLMSDERLGLPVSWTYPVEVATTIIVVVVGYVWYRRAQAAIKHPDNEKVLNDFLQETESEEKKK
jgi:YjbE family integral membrane protein